MQSTLLLVEDHRDIAEMIVEYFESKGFAVDYAQDGLTASHLATTQHYDLMILDLTLPGIDGINLCKSFRHQLSLKMPIVMLTARDTLDDKVIGLDSGADDYLVKPFSIIELEARVQAHLRRYHNKLAATSLCVGDLTLDTATLAVTRGQQPITLTPTGLKLLTALMQHSPTVVSRGELEKNIWGDLPPDSDALRSHMYTLRKAIDKPFNEKLIKTHPNNGYQIING